jgi:molecular chaperone GrpE (heat shock protein)
MNEETTQQLPNDILKLILARLDSIDSNVHSLDVRVTAVEEKVDRRLQETRPIWEGVLAEMKEMNARLTRVENEQKDFRRLLQSAVSNMWPVQDDFEERLDKLEAREVPK